MRGGSEPRRVARLRSPVKMQSRLFGKNKKEDTNGLLRVELLGDVENAIFSLINDSIPLE